MVRPSVDTGLLSLAAGNPSGGFQPKSDRHSRRVRDERNAVKV